MEQNDELQGCVFAVPSKTPWITSKPLVHKKKQHSEEYLRMKRIFRENDFSVHTDPETGEIVCKVIPKDMDAERKKAERAAQLTALADLMDSNGYTIDELKELISMPKPTIEEEHTIKAWASAWAFNISISHKIHKIEFTYA